MLRYQQSSESDVRADRIDGERQLSGAGRFLGALTLAATSFLAGCREEKHVAPRVGFSDVFGDRPNATALQKDSRVRLLVDSAIIGERTEAHTVNKPAVITIKPLVIWEVPQTCVTTLYKYSFSDPTNAAKQPYIFESSKRLPAGLIMIEAVPGEGRTLSDIKVVAKFSGGSPINASSSGAHSEDRAPLSK